MIQQFLDYIQSISEQKTYFYVITFWNWSKRTECMLWMSSAEQLFDYMPCNAWHYVNTLRQLGNRHIFKIINMYVTNSRKKMSHLVQCKNQPRNDVLSLAFHLKLFYAMTLLQQNKITMFYKWVVNGIRFKEKWNNHI